MEQANVRVWDPFVRIFHWSLVLSFTVAWLSGEEVETLHAWAGYAVIGLVLLRLVWGLIGTRYARFSDFVYPPAQVKAFVGDTLQLRARRYLGHNPAGGAMIILMLLCLVLVSVTGLAVYGIEAGAGPLSMLAGSSGALEEVFEETHEFLANLMVLLVVIHVAGVMVESLIHRDNLVKAMFTGRKHA
jgi:cytochrome b